MNQREKKRRQKLQAKRWREDNRDAARYASYRSMTRKFVSEMATHDDLMDIRKRLEARKQGLTNPNQL